jgi:hypothetical protein
MRWMVEQSCAIERCRALSLRSRFAMASIVRSSVRTQSWTEQVAEPRSDSALRFTSR